LYGQASSFIDEYRYDQAISLLDRYCANNPADTKAEVLLAKAYLGKCSLLKENADKQYKTLVYKPFDIGKNMIIRYKHNPNQLSEGLYICAHSYLINHRPTKAKRYITKAINISRTASPNTDYYFVLGDANASIAKRERREWNQVGYPPGFKEVKKTYNEIIAMNVPDEIKSLAYYKLGILFSDFKKKQESKDALNSALQLTENDILTSRIRSRLVGVEK
jgi:tetratricopeptide (TPR) repeat protein